MKKLNKVEKQIYWIFIISLIIDNINGVMLLNKINLPVSIGQIYRYFMLVFFLYYILASKKTKVLYKLMIGTGYLMLVIFIHFIEFYSVDSLIMDVTYAIKLLLPFIIIYFFYTLTKQNVITSNVIEKIFDSLSIIAPLTLIIPRILNVGYDAYDLGGYKGFYYSNNEINVLLVCTFIYAMDKIYKKRNMFNMVIMILNIIALFLIGSKTSIFVIGIVILVYIFKIRKNKKIFFGAIILVILGIWIGSYIFANQVSEMMQRFTYFYTTLVEEGGVLTFLMSKRNLRVVPTFQKNVLNVEWIQGIINCLFGIGRYQQVNPKVLDTLMELDFFDTFYWYGAITAIIVIKEYLAIFIRNYKTKETFQYKTMFIIIFAFSMIAGHVWYSALAGSIFALVASMILIRRIEMKGKN